MKIVVKNFDELRNVAEDFLKNLKKNDQGATVVGLVGELGAGKTAFVKKVAELLGIKDDITSPTFVIQKGFKIHDSRFKNLIHIDAYRISNAAEMKALRFDETLKNPDNLVLIEWPENIDEALPKDCKKIYFKFIDENTREISG